MNKKFLTSAIITALLSTTVAGTAFAAQNPFTDVPADSWAYDAIAQLSADGVIDGYPDGTYQGQNTMTRYEMAQIVARAMAKTDLDKADKATVDKLAVEFADELDNLGVRVSELEKKSDNVIWTGTVRYRYTDVDKSTSNASEHNLLYRLEPHAYIGNTGWMAHSRVEYLSNLNGDENFGTTVDRAWIEGDGLGAHWKLGKYPILPMNGMLLDDKVSGAEVSFGSDVFKTTVQAGRFNTNRNGTTEADMDKTTADYYSVQFKYNQDKWTAQAEWYLFDDYYKETVIGKDAFVGHQDGLSSYDFNADELNLWFVGLGYKFDDNLKLAAQYAENTNGDGYDKYGLVKGDESKAYNVELTYKAFDTKDPGSWDAFVAYRYVGAMASIAPVYKGAWADQKGIEFGVEFVPAENVLATLKYFDGKDISTDKDASKFFGQLELQF